MANVAPEQRTEGETRTFESDALLSGQRAAKEVLQVLRPARKKGKSR